MPTNVYLTSDCFADLALKFMLSGPTDDYNDCYHLLETTVPARTTSSIKVMSVDRGGGLHPGDAITMGELRISVGAQFVGALQVLLTNYNEPVKNTIWWSARTPTAKTTWFTSDHSPQAYTFDTPQGTFGLSFQGVGTVGFDDIELKITAVARTYTALATGSDPVRRQIMALTVDDRGAGTLWTAGSQDPPAWKSTPIPSPVRLDGKAAVAVGYTSDAPAPRALVLTTDQRLCVSGAQGEPVFLPLESADASLSLTVSEAQGSDGGRCDVFVVTRDRRLRRRTLVLAKEKVSFEGGWDDWGSVAADTVSYAPGSPYRYLFTVAKPAIGARGVYYCYADSQGQSWSKWYALPSLPNGAEPSSAVGVTWCDGTTPRAVGVVATGSDGMLYYTADNSFGSAWNRADIESVTGPAATDPLGGHPSVLVRARSGAPLSASKFWVKENQMESFATIDKTTDAGLFGVVVGGAPYALVQKTGTTVLLTAPA
jgi:hypothetical protein